MLRYAQVQELAAALGAHNVQDIADPDKEIDLYQRMEGLWNSDTEGFYRRFPFFVMPGLGVKKGDQYIPVFDARYYQVENIHPYSLTTEHMHKVWFSHRAARAAPYILKHFDIKRYGMPGDITPSEAVFRYI